MEGFLHCSYHIFFPVHPQYLDHRFVKLWVLGQIEKNHVGEVRDGAKRGMTQGSNIQTANRNIIIIMAKFKTKQVWQNGRDGMFWPKEMHHAWLHLQARPHTSRAQHLLYNMQHSCLYVCVRGNQMGGYLRATYAKSTVWGGFSNKTLCANNVLYSLCENKQKLQHALRLMKFISSLEVALPS